MPGTPPTGWQSPKTDWGLDDPMMPGDVNRMEGNAYATELGNRTIDPTQAPAGVVGTLRQLLDWFANRIKTITGTTNWHDAPPTTLTAAKSHIDAAAPHAGHETPAGAQAKVGAHESDPDPHTQYALYTELTSHANLTAPHSATSAPTSNLLMLRDGNGRAQVAAPSADADIARKDTVAAVQTNLDAKMHQTTGHKHTGAAGDGPILPYMYRVVVSDTQMYANDGQVSQHGGDWAAKKTVRPYIGGNMRITWQFWTADAAEMAQTQIYVDDVAVGSRHDTTETMPQDASEDITGIKPGTKIELRLRNALSGGDTYARYFRLKGDFSSTVFDAS